MPALAFVRYRKRIVIALLLAFATLGLQWHYRHPPQRAWPHAMVAQANLAREDIT